MFMFSTPVIVTYLIQLLCIIHIVKTGRSWWWIYLIIFLPVVGGLAYLVVEILPSLRLRRKAFPVKTEVGGSIIPGRRIKLLEEQLKYSDTFVNRKTLADEYYKIGDYTRALDLYKKCLIGLYVDDNTAKLGLVKCYYELKQYEEAQQVLEAMRNKNGDFDYEDALRLYCKTIEETEAKETVISEYEKIMAKDKNFELEYMYGSYLSRQNEIDKARAILNDIVAQGVQLKNLRVRFDRTWVQEAEKELKLMEKTK